MRTKAMLISILVLLTATACAQIKKAPDPMTVHSPLDQVVHEFALTDGALIDGIAELTSNPDVSVHLGFEEIIRAKIMDPRDRSVRFSLRLANKTVRQILDNLCQFDVRYTWSTDGASVNVYPRATVDDPSYLFNLHLDQINFKNIPDPDQALTALHVQFPKQQIGYMQTGGDNSYDQPWTATFDNLSVRQFANRIAEHVGPRTSWVWQGGRNERMFTFLKGGFQTGLRNASSGGAR